MVWLDLPRATVMRPVVTRTLRRRVRRTPLWNGIVEPPLWPFLTDGEHVVRWAWNTHAKTAVKVEAVAARRPDLPVVRLGSRPKPPPGWPGCPEPGWGGPGSHRNRPRTRLKSDALPGPAGQTEGRPTEYCGVAELPGAPS